MTPMIIAGVILLLVGFLAKVAILWTVGIVLVIVGLVLVFLAHAGHTIGGRSRWY